MTRHKNDGGGRYSFKLMYGKQQDLYIKFVNYINLAIQDTRVEQRYMTMERIDFIGWCAENFCLANKKEMLDCQYTLDKLVSRYMLESR